MTTSLALRFRLGLRRFPLVHKPVQWANRKARPMIAAQLYKAAGTVLRCFGFRLPKGFYSDYEQLCEKELPLEGRVVLKDQGAPRLPAESIMVLCGRKQHLEQPWPIFWCRHKNIRLLGPSLIHLNESDEISIEGAYGPKR